MKNFIYPFEAIVGQQQMKLSLILNVINPTLSGVLIRGEKGTGKSTVVRSLAHILPEIKVVDGCPFMCDPDDPGGLCPFCLERFQKEGVLPYKTRPIQVVELPVSATEDRVVGTLDIEAALKTGEKKFEPGLLAQAHRGFLYVDEVNLLDDHVVDVLLDAAAMGINTVQREGISFSHASRFVLVGTMNPEEGELRPQLLDRFGLCVNVHGLKELDDRVLVMKRRAEFEEDPENFYKKWAEKDKKLSDKIIKARSKLKDIKVNEEILYNIAKICIEANVDGHRADIIMLKAAKTLAAFRGKNEVNMEDVNEITPMVLSHRMRRQPFEEVLEGM